MAIGSVPYKYRYNFSVDNDAVDNTYTLKILGAALDCKLNFVAHVSEQVKKARAKASVLRRIRSFITFIKHILYFAPFRILLSAIAWSWKRSR